MRQKLNKLRAISYRYRAMTNHPSYRESKMLSNKYGEEILSAKRQHWESYLEDMSACDIWTANKYLRDPVGDGGSPQIPTLRTKDNLGRDIEVNDNQEKASLFIKLFFPPPPVSSTVLENFEYSVPILDPPPSSPEPGSNAKSAVSLPTKHMVLTMLQMWSYSTV